MPEPTTTVRSAWRVSLRRAVGMVASTEPITISARDLRRPKVLAIITGSALVLIGAPAAALHRSPAPGAAIQRQLNSCVEPTSRKLDPSAQKVRREAFQALGRYRRLSQPQANPTNFADLRVLMQKALADEQHPWLAYAKPTLNAIRLECGWADNPREVHESIVLELSGRGVPLDYQTAGPIHALAAEIAKTPTAIDAVTTDGRVELDRVFAWISALQPNSPAGRALAANMGYYERLNAAIKALGSTVSGTGNG